MSPDAIFFSRASISRVGNAFVLVSRHRPIFISLFGGSTPESSSWSWTSLCHLLLLPPPCTFCGGLFSISTGSRPSSQPPLTHSPVPFLVLSLSVRSFHFSYRNLLLHRDGFSAVQNRPVELIVRAAIISPLEATTVKSRKPLSSGPHQPRHHQRKSMTRGRPPAPQGILDVSLCVSLAFTREVLEREPPGKSLSALRGFFSSLGTKA